MFRVDVNDFNQSIPANSSATKQSLVGREYQPNHLIIADEAVLHRDVANHRGRSYVYDISAEHAVDGSFAGYPTRFINHQQNGANSVTRVKMVNGEYRIGVFAGKNMQAGTEVTIDYGPEFFKDEHHI